MPKPPEPRAGSRPVEPPDNGLILGKVSGLFGVRGWVKVYSFTAPREGILNYSPWLLFRDGAWRPHKLVNGRAHGKGVVAHIKGFDDRDAAAGLLQAEIAIIRDQLPALESGEYYWADLEGCDVVTVNDVRLGKVDCLFSTGANDVMVVKGERERLLPFVREQVVVSVDVDGKLITVDWDPEF